MGAKPGHSVSAETRAKISQSLKGRKLGPSKLRGRKQTPEQVEARIKSLRTRPETCVIDGCEKPTNARNWCGMHYYRWRKHGDPMWEPTQRYGAETGNWKGDEASYGAVHRRARLSLPHKCAACGTEDGRLELALLHNVPAEYLKRDGRHGPFSTRPDDYIRLCVTCHRRYDSPKQETRAKIEVMLTNSPFNPA
jgi:hypothetical protein